MGLQALGRPVMEDIYRPVMEEGTQLPHSGTLSHCEPRVGQPCMRGHDFPALAHQGQPLKKGLLLPQHDSSGYVQNCCGEPCKMGVQLSGNSSPGTL